MSKSKWPSPAALAAFLDSASPEAAALSKKFHRTMLWKYRTERRSPARGTAVELYQLSGGVIPIDGWPTKPRKSKKAKSQKKAA